MVEGGTLVWDYTVNNGSKQATGDVQITGRGVLSLIGSNTAPTVHGISILLVSGNSAIRMTGGTNIVSGTLRLLGAGRLPDSQPVSLGESATLDLNGISHTIGNLSGGAGSVITLSGANLTLSVRASFPRFDGVISGVGGLIALGPRVQVLRGANTYTEPTVIESGGIELEDSGSLPPTTSLTLNGGGGPSLYLGSKSQTVANLNSSFAVARIVGPGTLTIGSGDGVDAGISFQPH